MRKIQLVAVFMTLGLVFSFIVVADAVESKIGPGVLERLAGEERVRVVVFLSIEPTDGRQLDLLRSRVSSAQQSVLDGLDAAEFKLEHRYAAVPALAGEITREALGKLASMNGVVRIDYDVGGRGSLAQAVPLTNTDQVQALGLTGAGVTVAVLDSGIDSDHPDLADSLVGEACFCSGGGGCCPSGGFTQTGTGAAEDDHGHGSNVTGIVTSNGTIAPVGTAPNADIVSVKVLDSNNSFCCSSDIVAALDWIIDNRPDVDVVNMSLGTSATFFGDCDNAASWTLAFSAAINTLRSNGVLSFVSTGNGGSTTQMEAPACIANAISVGAVWDSNVGSQSVFCFEASTAADKITCFTNRNQTTDLFAPGAPITSASNAGGTSTFYGTSQASPHIAGCAADLLEEFPGLDPALLENALESVGITISDPVTALQYPRLDCRRSLNALACRDDDSDTYRVSDLCPQAGGVEDCDDGNAATYPGAPEICDGQDNDCDGDVPGGELTPPGRIGQLLGEPGQFSWDPEPLADDYDIVRGDLATLRSTGGDYAAATTGCEVDAHPTNDYAGLADPAPGATVWILIRGVDCAGAGSYDSDGSFQSSPRDAGIVASGVDCP